MQHVGIACFPPYQGVLSVPPSHFCPVEAPLVGHDVFTEYSSLTKKIQCEFKENFSVIIKWIFVRKQSITWLPLKPQVYSFVAILSTTITFTNHII